MDKRTHVNSVRKRLRSEFISFQTGCSARVNFCGLKLVRSEPASGSGPLCRIVFTLSVQFELMKNLTIGPARLRPFIKKCSVRSSPLKCGAPDSFVVIIIIIVWRAIFAYFEYFRQNHWCCEGVWFCVHQVRAQCDSHSIISNEYELGAIQIRKLLFREHMCRRRAFETSATGNTFSAGALDPLDGTVQICARTPLLSYVIWTRTRSAQNCRPQIFMYAMRLFPRACDWACVRASVWASCLSLLLHLLVRRCAYVCVCVFSS